MYSNDKGKTHNFTYLNLSEISLNEETNDGYVAFNVKWLSFVGFALLHQHNTYVVSVAKIITTYVALNVVEK